MQRLVRFLSRPLLVVAMAVCAFGIVLPLVLVLSRFPLEYGEGIIYHTVGQLIGKNSIYCDVSTFPCVIVSYPPAYASLVALLGAVAGLSLHAGRAVSFVAFLGLLVLLYQTSRATAGRGAALLAPLAFTLFVEVSYFSGIMRPDVFGLAVQMAGLCVLVHHPRGRGVVLATCLLLLSIYIKPNLLAGPLSAVIYLAVNDRRRGALSVGVFLVGGAAVLALSELLTDRQFLNHHLRYTTATGFSLEMFARQLYYAALPWGLLLAAAAAIAVRSAMRREWTLPAIYVLVAIPWALISASKHGAAAHYYFELYAASSLLVAHHAGDATPDAALPFERIIRWMIRLQAVIALVANPAIGLERHSSARRLWRNGGELVQIIERTGGLQLYEEPTVAAHARQPLFCEVSGNAQLARRGLWDQERLLAMIRRGDIRLLVLRDAPLDRPSWLQRERFTTEMMETLRGHFRLKWSDGGFYVYTHLKRSGP
jgi:hypothetical protein